MGEYMESKVLKRVISEADYIIETNKTIRETASFFGVSKSTVHKDMRERLTLLDSKKYNEVANILEYHAYIKHIRGGESTKKLFLLKKV